MMGPVSRTARVGAVVLLAALAFVALPTEDAGARAGGGEGYSGGSGSSSGGGSSSHDSSGGGGGGIPLPPWAVLMLTGVVFGVYVLNAYQTHVKQRRELAAARLRARETSGRQAGILRRRDPDFDPDRFLARVSAAFERVQAAWSAQDLGPVRAWLSDAVHERFSIQLAELRERGIRNRMQNVEVLLLEILEVESLEHFDGVAVRIRARATDERVDLESGKRVAGSRAVPEEFTEVWTFLRRRGSRSRSGPGLLESCCPGCGAPLDPRRPDCESCGAATHGAPRDWVLCEITQAAEWSRRAGADVFDAKRVRRADPGFSLEHLEDRASLLFWRWRDAVQRGDVAKLVSGADPQFVAAERRRLGAMGRVVADCAVGSVRTLGILSPPVEAAASGARERALVEIRWAGTVLDRDDPTHSHGEARLASWLVLGRRAGAQSELGRSLATARCGSCGGPDSGADAACSWCGDTLNDGSQDWVLLEVLEADSDAARSLLAQLREASGAPGAGGVSAGGLLAWAVALAAGDGRIDPRERRGLHRLAERFGVEPARLARWIEAALRDELRCELPDAGEVDVWLGELVRFAGVEGSLHPRERKVLAKLAERTRAVPEANGDGRPVR